MSPQAATQRTNLVPGDTITLSDAHSIRRGSASHPQEIDGALESELIARCKRGDRDAWDPLIAPYRGLIYSLARGICGDREWLEDAVLETLCQVYGSVGKFRGRSSFKTWVFRITTRVCRHELRRARRREPAMQVIEEGSPGGDDPASEALDRVRQEQALAAVARLPELYRLAVALRYQAECSYSEIATVLGIPEGTAKRRVYEGMKRIRRMFPETGQGEVQ